MYMYLFPVYAKYFWLLRVNLTCVYEYYIGPKNNLPVKTHYFMQFFFSDCHLSFSIPGLATWISETGYLLLPSRHMAEIPLKRRKSSIQLQPSHRSFTPMPFTTAQVFHLSGQADIWNWCRLASHRTSSQWTINKVLQQKLSLAIGTD